MRKIISLMHISLDGFVAGPSGEMNWIKVDEEIFIMSVSGVFIVLGRRGKYYNISVLSIWGGINIGNELTSFPKQKNKHHQLWKYMHTPTPQEKNGRIISGSF